MVPADDAAAWRSDERLAEQVTCRSMCRRNIRVICSASSTKLNVSERNENLRLPHDLDYGDVGGLSNEARQRLREVRPETLGQAARIPGLTPAAVSLLLVHLKKRDRAA